MNIFCFIPGVKNCVAKNTYIRPQVELSIRMEKKRIAIIGPSYPYRGGNSLFVSHLAESLSKDFSVTVLNYSLLYPSILFPGTTQYDESKTLIKEVKSERIVNSVNPLSWRKAAKRIKSVNPGLVVFDWWNPFFGPCHYAISELIKPHFKNRILFITENVISHESRMIDRILTNIGLANADMFLTLSAKVEADMKPLSLGRKIYRSELPIYDCYDISSESPDAVRKELGIKPGQKVLLFFGYIRKYKGLDILLEAMPLIKKNHPDARLLVVGESYEDPDIYLKLIEQLGMKDDVIFINKFIPNEEVGKYFSVADVTVLPYRSGTQSGILNIAYGFGCPVICTDVGGLAEFVEPEKTGLIIKAPEPKLIAEGIEHFYEMKEKTDFKTNIAEKVKQNSFNKINEVFKEIFRDIEDASGGS